MNVATNDAYCRQLWNIDIAAIERRVLSMLSPDEVAVRVHDEIWFEKYIPLPGGNMKEEQAFRQGKQDADIYGQVPTAKMVADFFPNYTDEQIVSYMNGVGDALAGL
jgi:hypothetical protein